MSCLLLSKHLSRGSFLCFCSPALERASSDAGLWRGCGRWGWGDNSCVHLCAEMSCDNELLPHVAEASLLRQESGLGARCDEWALCIFSCQWDLAGVLNYSPTRSGMNCSGQPTFPVGTCVCLHFLPRGCCVTHSSGGKELLYAVSASSTASGDVGFTAHTMWLLEHIHTLRLSMFSMHLKATRVVGYHVQH